MANSISHASLPYPIKNARYTLLVPYLDADGDPTDPTTPDTEASIDAAAFADTAEEVTTITGSNGVGYLTLTGAETNCSALALAFKVASGPKATLATLYPRTLGVVASGTASAGGSTSITLDPGSVLIPYNIVGCFVRTTSGTGGGGTGGANNQARRITAYNTSTQQCTVEPAWETTPDGTTTFDVLLPEGMTLGSLKALNPTTAGRTLDVDTSGAAEADVTKWLGTAAATPTTAGVPEVDVTHWLGTACATPTVAGVPEVDMTHLLGSPVVNDPGPDVLASGTIGSTGNSTTALHLTGLTYGDDEINDCLIVIKDVSTGEYHSRWITDWADTGDLATVATLPFTPENAVDTYVVLGARRDVTTLDAAGVRSAVGLASANLDTQLAAIDDYIDTEVAAIKAKTDLIPASPAAVGDIPTVSQIWTTALTESYAADGSTFTGAQALYEICQCLTEFAISGTTLTVKRRDGSTTAMTFTLDSATTPTSRTRAT